jgi:hypothetical protein
MLFISIPRERKCGDVTKVVINDKPATVTVESPDRLVINGYDRRRILDIVEGEDAEGRLIWAIVASDAAE